MAIPKIKRTYSLDVETTRTLERMAQRWGVSKSEALKRAIRSAASASTGDKSEALLALDELQQSLELDATAASRWAGQVREERRKSSQKREAGAQ